MEKQDGKFGIGVVRTKYGLVAGQELKQEYQGITLFKGIPYATPPVGLLRWCPPEEPKCWEGIKTCAEYGPICPQPSSTTGMEPWNSDFYFMGSMPMDEDCLYLNVATGAQKSGEKRPVYLWLHGGGTDHGYAHEIEFDPREMAKNGVVVVSVNHRLGPFGYMALPQLDAEQGKSGNYILMDCMKALEWVIENIERFGGDANCITVGGQSAGCMKTAALVYSPIARGHVKRVINQSWLNWMTQYRDLQEEESDWKNYLEALGINPELPLEELRAISSDKLLPTDTSVNIPGSFVYDGIRIPNKNLADSIEDYGMELDYLSGSNLGETHMKPGVFWGDYGFLSTDEFYEYCKTVIPDLYEKYNLEELIEVTEENVDQMSRKLASLGLGEWRWPGGLALNRYFGAYRRKKNTLSKTFSYLFTRIPPTRLEDAGTDRDKKLLMAWHSSELWYVFHSLRAGIPPCRPWEAVDYELAANLNQYWCNFIKTGNPNGNGLPLWPESDENFGYAELGEKIIAHRGLENPLDQMIFEYVTETLALPLLD